MLKVKMEKGNLRLLNMALNYKGPNENIENFAYVNYVNKVRLRLQMF